MFRVLILSLLLVGCSSTIVPKTHKQVQVVGYAQLVSVTLEVHEACASKILVKETCADLSEKIKTAKRLIDSNQPALDIIDLIRSKL